LRVRYHFMAKKDIDDRHGPSQGRSQTFWFGGATGGASFATRGAVNGLCLIALNNFNAVAWRHAENFGGPGKIFGGSGPPGIPLAPPLVLHQSYMTPHLSLFTLFSYYAIVFSSDSVTRVNDSTRLDSSHDFWWLGLNSNHVEKNGDSTRFESRFSQNDSNRLKSQAMTRVRVIFTKSLSSWWTSQFVCTQKN